jgi:hypothetical protein
MFDAGSRKRAIPTTRCFCSDSSRPRRASTVPAITFSAFEFRRPESCRASSRICPSPTSRSCCTTSGTRHLLALVILVNRYERGDAAERDLIFRTYLANTDRVNNWDLVDLSAPGIVGAHLEARSRAVLDKLAKSKSLWERRIAIVATYWFIRRDDFADTLRISTALLGDSHVLIHKAVGWMLREVGKRDGVLEAFLDEHARPCRERRCYSIERMSPAKRKRYMSRASERSPARHPGRRAASPKDRCRQGSFKPCGADPSSLRPVAGAPSPRSPQRLVVPPVYP